MPRRTKEELRLERNDKRLDELIQRVKFLREPKYYKNNVWSWAAWDSWAASGQAGSCACGCGYYNAALRNVRLTTQKGGRHDICKTAIEKLCYDCVKKIEDKINHKFERH